MHLVENKKRLKYAINTGIKRPSAQLFAPSSGLECGGQEADGFNQVLYPESPPRRRGPRLDSRLRGNDGRCCFHAFTARLKPGPDPRRLKAWQNAGSHGTVWVPWAFCRV